MLSSLPLISTPRSQSSTLCLSFIFYNIVCREFSRWVLLHIFPFERMFLGLVCGVWIHRENSWIAHQPALFIYSRKRLWEKNSYVAEATIDAFYDSRYHSRSTHPFDSYVNDGVDESSFDRVVAMHQREREREREKNSSLSSLFSSFYYF